MAEGLSYATDAEVEYLMEPELNGGEDRFDRELKQQTLHASVLTPRTGRTFRAQILK